MIADLRRPSLSVIPQKCSYRGAQYDCGVSVGCVLRGRKAVDLCDGGMVWSCCVPRDVVDKDYSAEAAVANAGECVREGDSVQPGAPLAEQAARVQPGMSLAPRSVRK